MEKINIFWFRRDLRIDDNRALFHALQKGNVLPIFIFDNHILSQLPENNDARVSLIYNQLQKIDTELLKYNSAVKIFIGEPENIFAEIIDVYSINSIFFNEDYEPYAIDRDSKIEILLNNKGISCLKYQDHTLCHPQEITKPDGTPYTVYTPYLNQWRKVFSSKSLDFYPSETLLENCTFNLRSEIELKDIGFRKSNIELPTYNLSSHTVINYENSRNFPAQNSTTHLSTFLRFGIISVRKIITEIISKSDSLLKELVWREFFISILYHYPKVINHSFKQKYDSINWRNNEQEFVLWKQGLTGYPIVDAGMRELNATGLMHNRVRMITASFLCKHLLIDWRWGETYFASKLLDFELASNNGNWQWASGSGCDAAPYFRIFNPALQTQKFDSNLTYVKKWVPELQTSNYPTPIVEHSFARNRALEIYNQTLKNID